uniref:hypothetical protein n=1 Tax=Ruegeria arenilitoris TaxID=1173585 RepID=UPI001480C680|nr:hypothetical protein [Ruegeria arenilitoris]
MYRLIASATLMLVFGCTQDTADNSTLQASCEALVAAEANRSPADVQALSTTAEPAGTVTQVAVAGAQAPWLCRADPSGVVTGVEYSQQG